MAIPPGGSSTINGILDQMLWTLLNAVEMRIDQNDTDPVAVTATAACLVVEPLGGGGDLVRFDSIPSSHIQRRIQQVKMRTDGGTWSLAELILDVLPDLYRAVDLDQTNDVYEFITSGRQGNWKTVETFFQSLRSRSIGDLDDSLPIHFGYRRHVNDPFFSDPSYTERTLFNRIVAHLEPSREKDEEAQRKVWHLLTHLECRWEQSPLHWREQVERYLFEVVDYSDDVQAKRRELLTVLAEKARLGGQTVRPADLFVECGLDAERLSNWQKFVGAGADLLRRQTVLHHYYPDEDVRPMHLPSGSTPIVIFSGESGQGKSWRLFSLASNLAKTNVIVFADATGDADADRKQAIDIFWQNIAGHDSSLSPSRLAARLRGVQSVPAGRWLYYFLDGVQNTEEAQRLAVIDWEGFGIRLILSAPPIVAQEVKRQASERATIIPVEDFTETEMRQYLVGSDFARWQAIPPDIRDTFRRPLLARLYKQTASGNDWTPSSEYGLYDRWWHKVCERQEMRMACLLRLTQSVVDGGAYPWSPEQMRQAGLDQAAVDALERRGAIQRAGEDRFAVWHDRLLNWLVAEALVAAWHAGALATSEFCTQVRRLFLEGTIQGRSLGYVPMDVVWMAITRHPERTDLHDMLLDSLAESDWRNRGMLFENLLPTIGPAIAATLVRYVQRHLDDLRHVGLGEVVAGLTRFDAPDLVSGTRALLAQEDPTAISTAIRLLAARPHSGLLQDLWQLNCEMDTEPQRFVATQESGQNQTWWLQHECFRALRACVRFDPDWLEAAIIRADPAREPVHDLAYLLANLYGERERWHRCKPLLREKLRADKLRAIATNIYTHQDMDEKDWLRAKVSTPEDSLGSYALLALIRLDPNMAVEALMEIGGQELFLTRAWCLRALLLRRLNEAQNRLFARLDRDGAHIMRAFQGQADFLAPEMLDWQLDRLDALLEHANSLEEVGQLLSLLAEVNRLGLLVRFELRKGTRLEARLADLLAMIPRPYLSQETMVREPALSILSKIGGRGFTRVINTWLAGPHQYGRYDALEVAHQCPDDETVRLLEHLATESSGEGREAEAYMAAEALVRTGAWPAVVRTILHLGMNNTPRSIAEASAGHACLIGDAIAPAIAAFEEQSGRHLGTLLALGVGGRSDYLERILNILEAEPPNSEVARACVLALSLLDDPAGQATPALVQYLSSAETQFAAINSLLRNPNAQALAALQTHLRLQPNAQLAAILLQYPETRTAAIEVVCAMIEQEKKPGWDSPFEYLHGPQTRDINAILLDGDTFRQKLIEEVYGPEDSIWYTGSKAHRIAALAAVESDIAFEAARYALSTLNAHDREYYPYLMTEMDDARAVSTLFDVAYTEKSHAVRAAVGRALAGIPNLTHPILLAWLTDNSSHRRLAACQLAAYQEPTTEIREAISALLEDANVDVVQAAEEALWCLQNAVWCRELVDAIAVEDDPGRRYSLLLAAMAIGDPGDLHRPWPKWLVSCITNIPHSQLKPIGEALKKRREEVLRQNKEADSRDK